MQKEVADKNAPQEIIPDGRLMQENHRSFMNLNPTPNNNGKDITQPPHLLYAWNG